MDTPSIETSPADVPLTSGESYIPEPKSAETEVLLGKTLDGRFRIEALIGRGTMGRVYRAVQLPLNRPVALKVLDSNYGAGREPSFRQRFLVEAALTARLSHPHTVRIYDYGCTIDGIFYLAMEYLDGATLERVLARGPLGWRVALSIAQQMSRALREAHALGVVHRDLKPANIMLLHADDDTEHVKVLDFGLVKSFVEGRDLEGRVITQQGTLVGSPPYMAPEQAERNQADPRSDIYSLGVMLYEMLTGRLPFAGRRPLEVILQHVNDPVPPLVTPRGLEVVPAALEAVVLRCLAKSPMDRLQSMEELLAALGEVRAEGASASPTGAGPASPRRDALLGAASIGEAGAPAPALTIGPGAFDTADLPIPRSIVGPLRPEGFPPDSPIGALQLWPPNASAEPRQSPVGPPRGVEPSLPFPRRGAHRSPWPPANRASTAAVEIEGTARRLAPPRQGSPRSPAFVGGASGATAAVRAPAASAAEPSRWRRRGALAMVATGAGALGIGLVLGSALLRERWSHPPPFVPGEVAQARSSAEPAPPPAGPSIPGAPPVAALVPAGGHERSPGKHESSAGTTRDGVTFILQSEPPGAVVRQGGRVAGATPLNIVLPRGPLGLTSAEFTLELEGYEPLTVRGGGSGSSVELHPRLVRLEPGAAGLRAGASAAPAARVKPEGAPRAAARAPGASRARRPPMPTPAPAVPAAASGDGRPGAGLSARNDGALRRPTLEAMPEPLVPRDDARDDGKDPADELKRPAP